MDMKNFMEENEYLVIWTYCYLSGENEVMDPNLVTYSEYNSPLLHWYFHNFSELKVTTLVFT